MLIVIKTNYSRPLDWARISKLPCKIESLKSSKSINSSLEKVRNSSLIMITFFLFGWEGTNLPYWHMCHSPSDGQDPWPQEQSTVHTKTIILNHWQAENWLRANFDVKMQTILHLIKICQSFDKRNLIICNFPGATAVTTNRLWNGRGEIQVFLQISSQIKFATGGARLLPDPPQWLQPARPARWKGEEIYWSEYLTYGRKL